MGACLHDVQAFASYASWVRVSSAGQRTCSAFVSSALTLPAHSTYTIECTLLPLVVDDPRAHGAIGLHTDATATSSSLSTPVYCLAFWYGLWCSAAWAMYHSATDGNAALVDFFKYIPAVCALVDIYAFPVRHGPGQ